VELLCLGVEAVVAVEQLRHLMLIKLPQPVEELVDGTWRAEAVAPLVQPVAA